MDILDNLVGLLGLILTINSTLMLISDKYLSFLSKSFLIEPASDKKKEELKSFTEENTLESRYAISFFGFGLALESFLWSFGIKKSFSFFVLPLLFMLVGYFFGKQRSSK